MCTPASPLDLALALIEDDIPEEAAALAAGQEANTRDLPFPVAD